MIIGHQKQWQFLERTAASSTIPHALLFSGQRGLGKRKMAAEFLKLVFKGDIFQSTDFTLVEPIDGEIQISQIRDLNWKLSLKPFSAPLKAAIIDDAHLMNQEAQNCFLKTLEEPKGDTLVILITEYPQVLLPTIRSRVQKINFYTVDRSEIEQNLEKKGLEQKEIKIISEIAAGRPGLAVDFAEDPGKLKEFKQKIKEFTSLIDSDLVEKFQYAKVLSEGDLREILNIWISYFRNILLSKLDLEKKWVVLRKEYTLGKIKDILNTIQNTIYITSMTNSNSRLALEVLFMEL